MRTKRGSGTGLFGWVNQPNITGKLTADSEYRWFKRGWIKMGFLSVLQLQFQKKRKGKGNQLMNCFLVMWYKKSKSFIQWLSPTSNRGQYTVSLPNRNWSKQGHNRTKWKWRDKRWLCWSSSRLTSLGHLAGFLFNTKYSCSCWPLKLYYTWRNHRGLLGLQ